MEIENLQKMIDELNSKNTLLELELKETKEKLHLCTFKTKNHE